MNSGSPKTIRVTVNNAKPTAITRQNDDTDHELRRTGEPDEDGVAHAERPQHIEEGALIEERLRERRVEQFLGQRPVRDAETHRDPQQIDGDGRRVAMVECALGPAARVQRNRAGPCDEEEHSDPENVDLLEDALDAERHHRHYSKKREDDRRVPREQPSQYEEATGCLDRPERDADGVVVEHERGDEEPVRGSSCEQRQAERDTEGERPRLRVALKRADRLRLGHAMLDEVRHASRPDRQEERTDHRQAQEKAVLGRV